MKNVVDVKNVSVLTVTYGDRVRYLEKVIRAVVNEGVSHVVVVANGLENQVLDSINGVASGYHCLIEVVNLSDNLGSSGGFGAGLKQLCKSFENRFIWLLDDDNCPEAGSLNRLFDAYRFLEGDTPYFALSSARFDRNAGQVHGYGYIKKYDQNNFCGLSLTSAINRRLRNFFRNGVEGDKYPLVPAEVAPYGGLFISLELVRMIGFPNDKYFLYADDHEYTNRIVDIGGSIFSCSKSKIIDIDSTIDKNDHAHPYFQNGIGDSKIYYGIRNHLIFSKKFKNSNLIFTINGFFFVLVFIIRGIYRPRMLFKRFPVFIQALRDGLYNRF